MGTAEVGHGATSDRDGGGLQVAAAVVGDGDTDAVAKTASEHPLAVEEWLASRVLERTANAREVCRLALVNRSFCYASLSDVVWDKQLPPKPLLDAILVCSTLHGTPLSKRDLYMHLCKSIPYDNGLKKFWLDPSSGGDCYMVSARGLSVIWGDTPQYWEWQPWPGAMFQEVAYLRTVCWFDVSGTFQQNLRPGKYLVSYRVQLTTPESGWKGSPIKLRLQNMSYAHPPHLSQVLFDDSATFKRRVCPLPETPLASQVSDTSISETIIDSQGYGSGRLPTGGSSSNVHTEEEQGGNAYFLNRSGARFFWSSGRVGGIRSSDARYSIQSPAPPDDDILRSSASSSVERRHETRASGTEWFECDVGEFLVEDGNGGRPVEVQFSMQEIQVLRWKGGFVLDGVIIRPSLVAEKLTIE